VHCHDIHIFCAYRCMHYSGDGLWCPALVPSSLCQQFSLVLNLVHAGDHDVQDGNDQGHDVPPQTINHDQRPPAVGECIAFTSSLPAWYGTPSFYNPCLSAPSANQLGLVGPCWVCPHPAYLPCMKSALQDPCPLAGLDAYATRWAYVPPLVASSEPPY